MEPAKTAWESLEPYCGCGCRLLRVSNVPNDAPQQVTCLYCGATLRAIFWKRQKMAPRHRLDTDG